MRVSQVAIAGLAAEAGHRGEGAGVGLLQHVLGLGLVAHHGAGDAEQALVAAGHDGAERLAVAGAGEGDEVGLRQGGVVEGGEGGHRVSSLTPIGCGPSPAGSREPSLELRPSNAVSPPGSAGKSGDTPCSKPSASPAASALFAPLAAYAQAAAPNDAQIAHIAYTAGTIDIAAGKQALAKSHDKAVRDFAQEMVRDHTAVNDQALALVKKLGVTPQDNPTSQALSKDARRPSCKSYAALSGEAFDKAYVDNEVAYHKTVNGALATR